MMMDSLQQLTHENNDQQKDGSVTSFVVPVHSGTTAENTSQDNTENAQMPDEEGNSIMMNKNMYLIFLVFVGL
jgi:hypothetical protein